MRGFLSDFGTQFRADHYVGVSVMRYAHIHAQYELYFCTENVEQKSVINGTEYIYKYPCAILSPPYTVHSMSCEDPDAVDFDRYVFYFDESLLASYKNSLIPSRMSRSKGGLLFPLTPDQANSLRQFLLLCDQSSEPVSSAQKELTFMLFLNKLFACCPDDTIVEVGATSDYIQQVIRYVAENFRTDIHADKISRRFAVSRSKLDRDFKKFVGITLHDFISSCRMNEAKILLESRQTYSVSEIAAACGFESETYFFPFFKRFAGVTPAEYRQKYFEEKQKNEM